MLTIAVVVSLLLVGAVVYRRSGIQVGFGILARNPDGGDYVAHHTRRITFALRDELRFGLVFSHRRSAEFQAQVIHYLPSKPASLAGSIDGAFAEQTPRGFRIAGPVLTYTGGGIRVLGLEPGDPIEKYELDLLINNKLAKSIKYEVLGPHAGMRRLTPPSKGNPAASSPLRRTLGDHEAYVPCGSVFTHR